MDAVSNNCSQSTDWLDVGSMGIVMRLSCPLFDEHATIQKNVIIMKTTFFISDKFI